MANFTSERSSGMGFPLPTDPPARDSQAIRDLKPVISAAVGSVETGAPQLPAVRRALKRNGGPEYWKTAIRSSSEVMDWLLEETDMADIVAEDMVRMIADQASDLLDSQDSPPPSAPDQETSWESVHNGVGEWVADGLTSPSRVRRKVLGLLDAGTARSLLASGRQERLQKLITGSGRVGRGMRNPVSAEKGREIAAAVSSAARDFLGKEEAREEQLPSDSGEPSRESMRMKPQQAGFGISGSTLAMGAAGLGLLLAVKKAMASEEE